MTWSKFLKVIVGLLVVLLIGEVIFVCYLFLPMFGSGSFGDIVFPWEQETVVKDFTGTMSLTKEDDGTLRLQWPEAVNAQNYVVDILSSDGTTVLFNKTLMGDCKCSIPSLPNDQMLTFRITAFPGEITLEATMELTDSGVSNLNWTLDHENRAVHLTYDLPADSFCSVFRSDTGELLVDSEQNGLTLTFGDDGQFPLPKWDVEMHLALRIAYASENMIYYGTANDDICLYRQDFLDTVLELESRHRSESSYDLEWNEINCEYYELALSEDNGKNWTTLSLVAKDGERIFSTVDLEPFTTYQFRVIAVGADTSDEATITTAQQTIHSTIWPLMDLEIYGDFTGQSVVGTAPAGTAYCVLENVNGFFGIRFGDGVGYIDSDYCMINLPEYVGDLCAYDIVNSYDSLYMIHEYGISKVTGTVISGYERVQQVDKTFLVPLLYPAAQKLVKAAQTAQMQGYRLKIYDSFRPHKASSSIYNLTGKIIGGLVPDETYTGKILTDLNELSCSLETLTYRQLMTDNGRYSLANFLANNISRHNLGVALDLTLEARDGKDLQMQTSMHDLSWYSELSRNNANANTLQRIMVSAGFSTLKSEWWHFQDNNAYETLGLSPLEDGVSAECWMKDGTGWRYRQANGVYLTACVREIDGVNYFFDSNGYATAR